MSQTLGQIDYLKFVVFSVYSCVITIFVRRQTMTMNKLDYKLKFNAILTHACVFIHKAQ